MILLIGNSGEKRKSINGQVEKVRLYKNILTMEKIPFFFIDLENFAYKAVFKLIQIYRYFKKSDRVVLLTAQRGVKILIPFLCKINKKDNKPLILPMIGINILHKYVDNLDSLKYKRFMEDEIFDIRPKKRDIRNLSKFQFILPENQKNASLVSKFFGLTNVCVLENFRIKGNDVKKEETNLYDESFMKLIFLSRVIREKGIFLIQKAVFELNSEGYRIKLDFYGEKNLNKDDEKLFSSLLNENIKYMGKINNTFVVETISKYDLFVFPTLFKSEGTPGVIAESFLAGTPILSSNFLQVSSLLHDNVDSLIFKRGDIEDLKFKIKDLYKDKKKLISLSEKALEKGKSFSYETHKEEFLKYICDIKI